MTSRSVSKKSHRAAEAISAGRMTLHRRYPSKQDLVEAVFARENAGIVAAIADVASREESLVDALTESLARGIESLWQSPLLARLYDTDREVVVPFLTSGAGPLMSESTRYILRRLDDTGGSGDSARAGTVAEAVIRACHSVLLVPEGLDDLREPSTLRNFLRGVIAALVDRHQDA